MITYRNSFWPKYGPYEYKTNSDPEEYRGHLIYVRIDDENVLPGPPFVDLRVWDIVVDGVCIDETAGLDAAKKKIDEIVCEYCEGQGVVDCLYCNGDDYHCNCMNGTIVCPICGGSKHNR